MPTAGQRATAWLRRTTGAAAPSVTYALISITLLVYLLQLFPPLGVTGALQYAPLYSLPQTGAPFEPWRMLTVALVHSPSSIFHVLFNMLSLWLFGQGLESLLGRWRFLALYVLSALGGSIAVLYLAPVNGPVVGASGAIFGLLGAFFIVQRKLGGNATGILVLVGLNLALGFIVPGISWQAHLGGLLVGAVTGLIYVSTRSSRRRQLQFVLVSAFAVLLVAVALLPALR